MDATADLIACPTCDALYRLAEPGDGQRAVCARCHTVLMTPGRGAFAQVVALSLTIAVLLTGAMFLPFIRIDVRGLSSSSSIFDAAMAFSGGLMLPLAVAVAAMILLIPLGRVILLIYTVGPMALGRGPARWAAHAFRLSERLKPWSMAEIFILGCAVALVKVGGLAQVTFGSAFWMFVLLVIVTVIQDGMLSKWSVWKTLERPASR